MLDLPSPRLETEPLLRIRGLSKTFENGVAALDGIDLALGEQPQILALLGPSGCGKSTLLRLIANLDEPTRGEVDWAGEGEGQSRLSFVFQDATLMPWETVFGNVHLPLRIKGLSRRDAKARIHQTLDRVGLAGFADAYPRQLSGGMRMRVSLARALVTEPRVLLMDEPFGALDEITRQRLERDLIDLWLSTRLTVILVTHSIFEAVFLASRIVIISPRPGRVAADIQVAAAYPRTEAFRTSLAYVEHCREVSAALWRAMGEGTPK